jgi:alpha-L-arabinofuranosidase
MTLSQKRDLKLGLFFVSPYVIGFLGFTILPLIVPLVAAAWREDRKAVTIGIVNATREARTLDFSISGADLAGKGTRYVITGDDPNAYNEPGKTPNVVIDEEPVKGIENRLKAPPISVCVYVLETK